jgi:hypothetical protein
MGFRRSPEITYETIDRRAVLVDGTGAELITLNPVGSLVWNALDGERDATALAGDLVGSFTGVTRGQLEADIVDFLAELAASRLVTE